MTPAIETRELRKDYGRRTALRGMDLTVEPGCVYGLVGPNGAGKTTALRMLLDIIRPTSGEVRVLGSVPREGGPALRRRIGYVPGELRLDGRATGRALLRHYAEISGPVAPGAVDSLAERLDLDLARPVRTLSKGNKQKLGLVQAFLHRPELLVLDEPTSGLDPLVQREFLRMVREARDAGQTVLLSSHVLSEIQQAADRVAVLSGGELVADGSVSELRLTAIRHVRGQVPADAAPGARAALAALPEVRELDVSESGRFSAVLDGPPAPLLTALAGLGVLDVVIEEPDLEHSVLTLYGQGTGDA
ncbi:ABC transporter ATP-binding protein [Saccharopolyspora sp. CA-218241]|uniref:ABC transporter ATP-binding protein n=1 Tax=Saccharopolyspora sp. CA-218241 TaxID=3240027 RepID=UPI003D986B14